MLVTSAECRVWLGLDSITELDRALLEMLIPMACGAVRQHLMYDPESGERIEFYPRAENTGLTVEAEDITWDSNGTKAFLSIAGRNNVLQLEHLPVRSISEVKVDYNGGFGQESDTFGADTIWTAGTDYFLDITRSGLSMTGHLMSYRGWPLEPGTVKVTYTSGYSSDELAGRATTRIDASPIKNAALLTVAKAFKTAKVQGKQGWGGFAAGPLNSESLGDYSYSTDGNSVKAVTGMMVSLPSEAVHLLQPFRHYGQLML
jgi:hypothetical protein